MVNTVAAPFDRTVLPIAEPTHPAITELDARKAKAPPIIRGQGAAGRAQCDGDPARQFRVRRLHDLRRRDAPADARAPRQERVDLQQFPYRADLLGEPRGAADRPQSP